MDGLAQVYMRMPIRSQPRQRKALLIHLMAWIPIISLVSSQSQVLCS